MSRKQCSPSKEIPSTGKTADVGVISKYGFPSYPCHLLDHNIMKISGYSHVIFFLTKMMTDNILSLSDVVKIFIWYS